MKKLVLVSLVFIPLVGSSYSAFSSPKGDLKAFKQYFKKRFPDVNSDDFKNGVYALDTDRRDAWQESEDFAPPYEDAINLGKQLFNKPFSNGKTYGSCFKNGGIGIKQNYPRFDAPSGKVITLEQDINSCRTRNGEKALKYKKGIIAAITAYMAFTSRGKVIDIKIPDNPKAMAIYARGKKHFYSKRGQLNFSCADCHVYGSGNRARADLLSPALGHVTHFPVWRKKWAANSGKPSDSLRGLGTIQRRYSGCNNNIRAKPFKVQGDEYTALEYFHTYMSNGQVINGPALRQ